MKVRLAPGLREQMLTETRRCAPLEACGLLGGCGEEVLRFVPCKNMLESSRRFAIAAEEIAAAEWAFLHEGLAVVGVFHSHPLGPARPSATDLRSAHDADALYLISSARSGDLRAYRRAEGTVREVAMDG